VSKRAKNGQALEHEWVEDRWITMGTDRRGWPDNDRDLVWVMKSTSFKGEQARSVKIPVLECGHDEYADGHCAEMICSNYTSKQRT
jgi:hypothetical protein